MHYDFVDNSQENLNILMAVHKNDGYCPCKIEKSEDTKCPCKEFREQEPYTICGCGLYKKYNY